MFPRALAAHAAESSIITRNRLGGARGSSSIISRFSLRSEELFSFEIWRPTPSLLRQITALHSRPFSPLGLRIVERILCFHDIACQKKLFSRGEK